MNLEVGKTYGTRNGCCVLLEHDKGDSEYPFYGKVMAMSGEIDRIAYFSHSGRYNRTTQSGFDIIREVT